MKPYWELPGFEGLSLEDGYVLDIEIHPRRMAVRLDAVLTEKHPEYRTPPPTEVFCFRRARMEFGEVRRLHWLMADSEPAVDATGEPDHGHVDEFGLDGERYTLSGEFGDLEIEAATCRVELEP